jgi:hypothetical protein
MFFGLVPLTYGQFRTDGMGYTGADVRPMHLIFSFHDGPAQTMGSGDNQELRIANELAKRGLIATFYEVPCHYFDQPIPDPLSSLCKEPGNQPFSILDTLVQKGQIVGNHTQDHVPLGWIVNDPGRVLYQVNHAQQILAPYQPDGLSTFTSPGFSFSPLNAATLNANPHTAKIIGPVNADLPVLGTVNGDVITGDWDCVAHGVSAQDCADLIWQQIQLQAPERALVVMIHLRTELEVTSMYAYNLVMRLLSYLDTNPEYAVVPIDAIPGILGGIRAPRSVHLSEFGDNDGLGKPVVGDVAGVQKASVCKARTGGIYCSQFDGAQFQPSTLWLPLTGPSWQSDYSAHFWLSKVTCRGRADLVYFDSQGVWVGRSNGRGFDAPTLWLDYFSTRNGWDASIVNGVFFGDMNGDGYPDLWVWTPSGIMVALNSGVAGIGFLAPQLVSTFFSQANGWGYPQYLSTGRVTDVDGDGLADFCERGAAQVFCAFSSNRTLGAPMLLPAQPAMSFAGAENMRNQWMHPSNGTTFDLIHIRDHTIAATAVPTGVIFSQAIRSDQSGWQFSSRYRYLCNDCFTTPGWAPDRQASAILWGDFDGSGNDSPCFVRPDGLDISLVQIVP